MRTLLSVFLPGRYYVAKEAKGVKGVKARITFTGRPGFVFLIFYLLVVLGVPTKNFLDRRVKLSGALVSLLIPNLYTALLARSLTAMTGRSRRLKMPKATCERLMKQISIPIKENPFDPLLFLPRSNLVVLGVLAKNF